MMQVPKQSDIKIVSITHAESSPSVAPQSWRKSCALVFSIALPRRWKVYAEPKHEPTETAKAGTQPVPLPAAMPAESARIPPPIIFFAIATVLAGIDITPGGGAGERTSTDPPRTPSARRRLAVKGDGERSARPAELTLRLDVPTAQAARAKARRDKASIIY